MGKLHGQFLLDCTYEELLDANGLRFIIKDHDTIGDDGELGCVKVNAKALVNIDGSNPVIMKINPPSDQKFKDAGTLKFSSREATEDEKERYRKIKTYFEILSCRLPKKGNPYVRVILGKKEIHTTEYINNSRN